MNPVFEAQLKEAAAHLSASDPVLARVIAGAPLPDFAPHTDYYRALVNSIIGQQLSVKAAATIKQRFVDLFDGSFPTPEQILGRDIEELRSVGLSRPKARYVQDLAQHIVEGTVRFDTIDQLSNDEIIAELTAVKGVGEWTVHMFLLFCMGRLDVLPTGDLGIRSGIKKLYGMDELPSPDEVRLVAEENDWHPYESVASWYVWHSLDNAPK
ncbi:MAG TPA: DNA-3-methyladenine glycosylase [Candidatus Saccharimonadales bacterium]|nr:DNA-3-methyladenine glycosylase [Candidatus Saccharimonadales bacterium]